MYTNKLKYLSSVWYAIVLWCCVLHVISIGLSPNAVHWRCACSPAITWTCLLFDGKYAGAKNKNKIGV